MQVSWNKLNGAKKYKVKYQKAGLPGWIATYSTTDTFYTILNLDAAVKYTVQVQGVCQAGGSGAPSTISKKTSNCTLPASVTNSTLSSTQQQVTITPDCGFDTMYCRYGTSADALDMLIFSTSTSVTLTGLQPGVKYYYEVSTCPLLLGNFTETDSFQIASLPPNIILIVLDDARYDQFSCNGAPPFVSTPNIDRIANEGINFKNSFVTHSECGPSRATIATGVYSHRHGVHDNVHPYLLDTSLPLLPKILNQAGYWTAMVGKTHDLYSFEGNYFDYWLEYLDYAGTNSFKFEYMGDQKVISGYDTDIMSDSAVAALNIATEPFFLQLGYRAPHEPLEPAAQYDEALTGIEMPFGPDTADYTINYPSYLDNLSNGAKANTKEANKIWRETFEMLMSVDDGIGAIFNQLQQQGRLDRTMIIFTSDNGHMIGEHGLDAKRFAYEQSIRVPLFIRYPQWFSAGSIDAENHALNIDYFPTIAEAAGIEDSFDFDGVSLRQFYNGSMERSSFYYHYWYSPEGTWINMPYSHAIRDNEYVFISYGCSADTTEEFFDLVNDPLQMTNLINTSSYSSLINTYRSNLQQMRIALNDTASDTQLNCTLANPVYTKESVEVPEWEISIYPNPSDGHFTVRNHGVETSAFHIYNQLNQPVLSFEVPAGSIRQLQLPASGVYFICHSQKEKTQCVKLFAQ
jgi:N-acetylglucosamine-6-sulfatase